MRRILSMRFSRPLGVQVVLFITYILAVIFFNPAVYLISPLHNLLAASTVYFCAKGMVTYRRNWYLISAAIFFWGLAELIMGIGFLMGSDLITMQFYLIFIYALSNLMLLITALDFFIRRLDRYNLAQLIADGIMILVVVLGIGSGVYFVDLTFSVMPTSAYVGAFIYLTIAFFTLIIILVMGTSSRKNASRTLLGVFTAILIHLFADGHIIAHYFLYANMHTVTSDILIIISFNFLTLTAILKVNRSDDIEGQAGVKENYGKPMLVYFFSVLPLAMYFIGFINTTHLIALTVVIVFHLIVDMILQRMQTTVLLLEKEKEIKAGLEAEVAVRTEELRAANLKLEEKATKDALTGLYNRRYFMDILKMKTEISRKEFSILFIDLDRFKVINDIHGHSMGDLILAKLAQRFKDYESTHIHFSRFGGDEFAAIVDEVDVDVVENIASEIIALMEKPIHVEDLEFSIGASIGISRYPSDAVEVKELLKFADIAMYHAKKNDSTNAYVIHSAQFATGIQRRNLIELLLKKADFDEEFKLYYQPQFDLDTGALTGMEALIRWFHPEEGFISPGEFIPIAEEVGMIHKITEWVFDKGMKQIAKWNRDCGTDYIMSMNVSPISLDNMTFLPMIKHLIEMNGTLPAWLGFEITEHSAMATASQMEEFLVALSGIGVEISIDDFGTGYSSLSYLKRFEVDTLKIARELIDQVEDNPGDRHIVEAIIVMSHALGMKTIGEGVERDTQMDILRDLKCDIVQGFFSGRPVSEGEFEKLYLEDKSGK